ncbi:hypothetical protein H6503_00570 [Candidatus Woesearchaeota archaeon]|nr:hypothetical protein [Candidatus Woesearchaeota archaeon]
MTEESTFYMAIEDPRDFRRELLGSGKQVIQLLQRYENIKKIREQKIKLIYDYNQINKEINGLIFRLKKYVPQTNLRNKVEPKSEKKRSDTSDLKKLHQELAEIEAKLGKLK